MSVIIHIKNFFNLAVKQIPKKQFIIWFGIAVILRLLFLYMTMHGDLFFIHYYPTKLGTQGLFDIYRNGNISSLYYPPLTYFFIGVYQLLLKPFNPEFYNWIQNIFNSNDVRVWLVNNGISTEFFKQIFFMKFPVVVFDFLCFFIILRYLEKPCHKKTALKLWSINPVILYGIYGFGQIDIIPAFFAALSLLLIKYKNEWWGFFCLSVAALFKTFTIFMVLPFLILLTRSKRDLFKKLLALIIPFIIVFLPLLISSKGRILRSIFFDPGDKLIPCLSYLQKSITIIFFILLYYVAYKLREKEKKDHWLLMLSIASLMILYSVAFIPVHYFIWITPFLIIAVSDNAFPLKFYWFLIVLVFLYCLNSPNTTSRLLMPINPKFFYKFPSLPDLMHKMHIKWGAIMLSARLIFTASCVLIAFELIGVSSIIERLFKIKIGYRKA
ncbi:MAG: glycosyltransferase 87 family protein [Patescibacteria group bacterium]